jgi:hypothetical protein
LLVLGLSLWVALATLRIDHVISMANIALLDIAPKRHNPSLGGPTLVAERRV